MTETGRAGICALIGSIAGAFVGFVFGLRKFRSIVAATRSYSILTSATRVSTYIVKIECLRIEPIDAAVSNVSNHAP